MHALRSLGLFLLAALVFGMSPVGSAQDAPVDGAVLDFAVERNNAEIGFHRIRFTRTAERMIVDTEVRIRVTAMFVTVFRFDHRAREIWEGGRLVALDAETDDDGVLHRLSVRAEGDALAVMHNGEQTRVQGGLIPTSLWNRAITERTVLLGTLRGDAMPTQVTRLGARTVPTGAGAVAAEGFLLDARPDYKRSVWYDGSGRLVAVQLNGGDGSLVTYRLR
jgi:hypothetical protein